MADNLITNAGLLRQRAETFVLADEEFEREIPTYDEWKETLHELRVHQIELEMQNVELLRTHKKLEESQARYFTLYNNAPIGYITLREDGLILESNIAATAMLGLVKSDLHSKTISQFIFREDKDNYYLNSKKVFEELNVDAWEMRMVSTDGSNFWARVHASPVCSGEYGITLSNITTRKQAEETVRKLFTAVEQSPTAILITDTAGDIEYANPRFAQMTGWSREEAIGKNPRLLKGTVITDELYLNLWDTICSGNVWEGDFHNKKKDGSFYWEHATISPIKSDSGTITHYLAIKEDITEKRSLEEQLRQAQKMEAVGQLAGGVAHDFNNILQVIMGNAQLQIMTSQQHDLSTHHLDEIFNAVERGASLTRSMLVFCRKQPMELKLFDLNKLVQESQKLASRLVTEEISIELKLADLVLNVIGDFSMVQNVVFNLVTNARDAIAGRGAISIGTQLKRITEDFSATHGVSVPEGDYAVLSVQDTGCGITEAIRKKIFDPFFTTKEVGKGTGLGLAMVYGTVQQMEGFIIVDSPPEGGTSFSVFVPLVENGTDENAEAVKGAVLFGQGELLLFVEDEEAILDSITQILNIAQYRVICAANGEAAIRIAKEHASELKLSIMDMILPDMNGKEIARELTTLCPNIPVLFLSGYNDENRVLTENSGNSLQKPIHPVELLKHVRRLLDSSLN